MITGDAAGVADLTGAGVGAADAGTGADFVGLVAGNAATGAVAVLVEIAEALVLLRALEAPFFEADFLVAFFIDFTSSIQFISLQSDKWKTAAIIRPRGNAAPQPD